VPAVLVGAFLSCLYTWVPSQPFQATTADLMWLALLGLTQLALPCMLAVMAARTLKAPEVSLLGLLEVIFGILWPWLFVHEAPGGPVLLGGGVVILALVGNELLGWQSRAGASRIHTLAATAPPVTGSVEESESNTHRPEQPLSFTSGDDPPGGLLAPLDPAQSTAPSQVLPRVPTP